MAAEGFCRFCLVTGLKMETVNVEEIECFSDLTESDFPLLACYECKAMIRKLNVFLTKLVTSLAIQRHMLQSGIEISKEDIKQIDRESLKLISSLKYCDKPLVISCDTNPEDSFHVDTIVLNECSNKRKGKVKEEIIKCNENEDDNEEYIISSENDDEYLISSENNDEKYLISSENDDEEYLISSENDDEEYLISSENDDEEYIISSENDDILDTISLDGVLEDRSNCLSQEEKLTGEKKQRKKRARKQKVSNEEQGDGDRKSSRFKRPDVKKICLEEFFDITDMTLSEQIEEFSKRKESPNYKNNPYKCELCYRGFKRVNTYQNHVNLLHNPELGRWKCQVCQRHRSSPRSMYKHMESHSRLYSCKICDFVAIPRVAAVNHANWHKGAIYECRICSQVFEHPQSRLGHERIKHPSASSCDICGLPFVSALGVVNHKRMAHFGYKMPNDPPDPNLYCKACKIQFASLEAWSKHLETSAKHKPLSETTDLVCRHCGEACADAAELNAHQKEKHVSARDTNPPLRGGRGRPRLLPPPAPGETPEQRAAVVARARAAARATSHRLATVEQYPQQCAHCDEILLNPQNHWRHHIGRHFGKPYKEAKFMCELCGKRFMYEANLRGHVELKHTKPVGAFECELCKAKMNTKLALYCHMQRHLKPSHPCSLCGKALATASSLKTHLRNQHGGPRPFECSYCHKTFIRGSILKLHVNEVHLRLAKKRIRDKTKKRITIGSLPILKPNDNK